MDVIKSFPEYIRLLDPGLLRVDEHDAPPLRCSLDVDVWLDRIGGPRESLLKLANEKCWSRTG